MRSLSFAFLVVAFATTLDATALRPATLRIEAKVHNVHGPILSTEMATAYSKYRDEKKISLLAVLDGGYDARLSVRGDKLFLDQITFTFDRSATARDVIGVEIPP